MTKQIDLSEEKMESTLNKALNRYFAGEFSALYDIIGLIPIQFFDWIAHEIAQRDFYGVALPPASKKELRRRVRILNAKLSGHRATAQACEEGDWELSDLPVDPNAVWREQHEASDDHSGARLH